MALSGCLFTCVCACWGSWPVGDELQTQMVGISRLAGWGQISCLPCLSSLLPFPLSPRGAPVCNSTRFGKPHVLMEADHGLISSHSTISGPSRLGAPREKGRGCLVGMSVWKQPCFEKVMLLSLSGIALVIRSNFTPLNGALCKCTVICTFIAQCLDVEPPFFH